MLCEAGERPQHRDGWLPRSAGRMPTATDPGRVGSSRFGLLRSLRYKVVRQMPARRSRRTAMRSQRQLSFRVSVEPVPVLAVRFDEPSQVTVPSGFFLTYLYWMAVFFGSHTVVDQTG
jgi:hypothetical protein